MVLHNGTGEIKRGTDIWWNRRNAQFGVFVTIIEARGTILPPSRFCPSSSYTRCKPSTLLIATIIFHLYGIALSLAIIIIISFLLRYRSMKLVIIVDRKQCPAATWMRVSLICINQTLIDGYNDVIVCRWQSWRLTWIVSRQVISLVVVAGSVNDQLQLVQFLLITSGAINIQKKD